MHFSPARFATAAAAAALIALPVSALAQSNPAQNPPSQPPTQTQPQTQPPPQQQPPPASAQAPSSAATGQVDANAAKQHLTQARDALSQLTSMPEASKLQGDARTKVSELISNFNALISAQTDWRGAYGKVNDSLTALLGPDTSEPPASAGTTGTGTAGTAGTTGSEANAAPAGSVQLDPAIRGKLVEFRTHLKEFEKAAGGAQPSSSAPSSSAMPPSAAPDSTSNPANPATATNPTANPPASAVGTTGTSGASETAGTTGANSAAQTELAAIDAILAQSKTGALTQAQTSELKRHIDALRALIK